MPPPTSCCRRSTRGSTKLRAEEAGVAAALKSAAGSLWPPLLDAVTVAPGFEKALGAAFGEDLEASSDRGAPTHWLPLGLLADAPALPEGATPLSAHVKALPELERRIGFIGIVADDADGRRAAAEPQGRPAARHRRGRGVALGRLHDAGRRAVDRGGAPQPAQPAGRHPPADRRRRGRAGQGTGQGRRQEALADRGARGREALCRQCAAQRAAGRRVGAAQGAGSRRGDPHGRAQCAERHRRGRTRGHPGARPACRGVAPDRPAAHAPGRHRADDGRDRGRRRRGRDAPHLPPGAALRDCRHPGRPRDGRHAARPYCRAASGAGRGRRRTAIAWRAKPRCGSSGSAASLRITRAGASA